MLKSRKIHLIASLILPFIGLIACAPALARVIAAPVPAHLKYIETHANSDWDCSKPDRRDNYLDISFLIGEDSKLYNPEIYHCFENDQFAAECLEAVLSLAPLPEIMSHTGFLERREVGFTCCGRCPGPGFQGNDIRDYLAQHEQPSGDSDKFVVVHKIPLSVLYKYPGEFTKDELLSSKNLVQICVGAKVMPNTDGNFPNQPSYVARMAALYAYWANVFAKEPKMSKAEILQYAQSVPI